MTVSRNVERTLKIGAPAAEWYELAEHWQIRIEADSSPNTVRLYRIAVVGTFLPWLERTGWGGTLDGITSEHLNLFILELKRTKSPATTVTYRAGLASFWAWLKAQGEVTENLFRTRDIASVQVREPHVAYLTLDQIDDLMKAARRDRQLGPRNVALIALMLGTGLRVAEVAALDVDDLVLTSRKVFVRHGKGDRARQAGFGATTADALSTYLRWRRRYLETRTKLGKRGLKAETQAALFVTRSGARLTDAAIRRLVGSLGALAGIPGVHPHRLRHSHFSQAALSGADEWAIRQQGGWSRTSAMPLRYTAGVQQERALATMSEHDPMDKLRRR